MDMITWVTIVWDDPVNLTSTSPTGFRTYLHHSKSKATKLTLQVQNQGKTVVSSGTCEAMEADVDAMHAYGLWAGLEKAE